ncbi:MAG: DEAD/DEAH box helicase [Phycisphaerales bacterium]|nr:DEAD/DEAH box helicase [Phycisphaerales bacterium]
MSIETVLRFAQLGLAAPILQAIDDVGYESPSPIQAASIPTMLAGRDLLGQAQTGTGKTAAFALPILCRVDTRRRDTQALILTPTRELAIQVAEAIHTYGRHLDGLHVLPVYGGQHIGAQLRPLQRGVHIVVGTPGRIIDHLERGTLKLDTIETVVLDEADEMLRMGFIEDVNRILDEMPDTKQVALFSATMPPEVRRIADKHLKSPEVITIETATTTVDTVRQRYLIAPWRQKLDAMTRILETTDFNAMLIFVRTKVATLELSEKLEARGHASAPLNGDMTQILRERTVQRLRDGSLDIVVATDVAARGLDVGRITHVVNYDIPNDTEAYVHRIGRTGRAGRDGEAILLVQPREKRMLRTIERATGQLITPMQLPSSAAVTDRRVALFKQTVNEAIESQELGFFREVLGTLRDEHGHAMDDIAAALAFLVQQDRPLQSVEPAPEPFERRERDPQRSDAGGGRTPNVDHDEPLLEGMARYRLEVGQDHGVQPKHIVGAIANETGLDGRSIGRITVNDVYTILDMPADMPGSIFEILQDVEIFGHPLRLSTVEGTRADNSAAHRAPTKSGGSAKGGKHLKASKGGKATKGAKAGKIDTFAKGGKSKGKPKKSKSHRD